MKAKHLEDVSFSGREIQFFLLILRWWLRRKWLRRKLLKRKLLKRNVHDVLGVI
jgi:hypothetical protein